MRLHTLPHRSAIIAGPAVLALTLGLTAGASDAAVMPIDVPNASFEDDGTPDGEFTFNAPSGWTSTSPGDAGYQTASVAGLSGADNGDGSGDTIVAFANDNADATNEGAGLYADTGHAIEAGYQYKLEALVATRDFGFNEYSLELWADDGNGREEVAMLTSSEDANGNTLSDTSFSEAKPLTWTAPQARAGENLIVELEHHDGGASGGQVAFDDVRLTQVPAPGALPVGLALLGGMAMIRRRQRA